MSDIELTLDRGSSWSADIRAGLSKLPWVIGPVVVKARGSREGRNSASAGAVALVAGVGLGGTGALLLKPEGTSSFGEVLASLPFSRRCPPSVAHFRIVWIRWFCLSGFDRYSSICAWIHFSLSPNIACAVRAIIGVRWVPRLRSYSRIFPVASKPPWRLISIN
jgi:hypothetical protein